MGFSKNRKGSGAILTGAFAVPAAMSLAQQGVVGAEMSANLDGNVNSENILKSIWDNPYGKAGIITTLGVLILIGVFIFATTRVQVPDGLTEREQEFCKFIATTSLKKIKIDFKCGEQCDGFEFDTCFLKRRLKEVTQQWKKQKAKKTSFRALFFNVNSFKSSVKERWGKEDDFIVRGYAIDDKDLLWKSLEEGFDYPEIGDNDFSTSNNK